MPVRACKRWRLAMVVLLCAAFACSSAACSSANVKPQHTGRFDQQRPIIALGTCCIGYDPDSEVHAIYANDPQRPTRWQPVVEKSGLPFPAGHHHDAYYTGDTVRGFHEKRPASYLYRPPKPAGDGSFQIELAKKYPGLRTVDFHEFNSFEDGRLTRKGIKEVKSFVKNKYGETASMKRLGEGGFAVAYRVCRKPRSCVVVKIRKMLPTFAAWKRIKQAESAALELKRDLAIAEVAEMVTSWARYVGKDGKPVPMTVAGKALPALKQEAPGPIGRLAHVAGVSNPDLLREGTVEQALIAFWPSAELKKIVADANKEGSTWRAQAMQEAASIADIRAVDANNFFAMYNKTSKFGPDVIKAYAFFQRCRKLQKLPTVARYCHAVRREFGIPDDFAERVAALEWMYRDSAAEVIRFTRANFGRALGNPAQDGEFREIGLDYNHGRNVGWDPTTRQFVLFDF